MSVWDHIEIPHGIGDQCISQYNEFFTAFERRFRLRLQRLSDTNTLQLCLYIDPSEPISARWSIYSFSAVAYDLEDPFIPISTNEDQPALRVYGNAAHASDGWAYDLSMFPGPLSPISHRRKFPSDQMMVHCIIKENVH